MKCDDECARLERNAKLALALDIDPTTHTDDHIPYSTETLKLFADNAKWGEEQEREFRVFAATEVEKRMRFKPMPAHQRSFLHALAEDFGLDSESLDPEPHRHVAVFKTPRFVSSPTKTLRDCMRIRQRETAPSHLNASIATKAKPATATNTEPYNGLLLTNVRFALTLDELHAALLAALGPHARLTFTVQFLPTGDVALRATPLTTSTASSDTERTLAATISDAKPAIARAFNSASPPFGFLQLARFDDGLNVLVRESDVARSHTLATDAAAGWSQVAARSAAPRRNAPPQSGVGHAKNGFLVLGNLNAFKDEARKKDKEREAKRKEADEERRLRRAREEQTVVEDWEVAAEEEERSGSGGEAVRVGVEGSGAMLDGVVAAGEVAAPDAAPVAEDTVTHTPALPAVEEPSPSISTPSEEFTPKNSTTLDEATEEEEDGEPKSSPSPKQEA